MTYIQILLHLSNVLPILAFKITALIIGYLIVKIGNELLEKGITGEFKFTLKYKDLETNLASGLPGLFFVLLGVLLMGYAIFVDKPFETLITTEIHSSPTEQTQIGSGNIPPRPETPKPLKPE